MFTISTPSDRINIGDLEQLIQQPSKPFIIIWDFNSHSNVWGCDTNQKGRKIEDVINRNNLLLYNNKTYPYLHPGTETYSAIDLTLADASIFLDYSWKVVTPVRVTTFQSFYRTRALSLMIKFPGGILGEQNGPRSKFHVF